MNLFNGWKTRNAALVIMLAIVFPLSILTALTNYALHKNDKLTQTDHHLFTAATFMETVLPDAYHDRIENAESISPEEYRTIVERNNELCKQLKLEYLWSLLLIDGHPVFTSSTSTDKLIDTGKYAAFFEVHSNQALYEKAFQTMEPQSQYNRDKWGDIRAVLIPKRDSKGRKYLICASTREDWLTTAHHTMLRKTFITAFIFLIPGILLCLLISRGITRPLTRLFETAQAIGAGDYNPNIKIGSSYELNVVSREFEKLCLKLRSHIQELNTRVEQIQEFERGVNAGPVVLYKLDLKNNFSTEFISENISMAGYTAVGIMNNQPPFASLVPEQSLLELRERLAQAMAAETDSFSAETEIIWSDGSVQPHLNWYRIINDKNGSPHYLQGMSLNIKEVKETNARDVRHQKQLKETMLKLHKLQNIVVNSPILIYRVKLDENLTTEFISENISIMGYSPDSMLSGKLHWKEMIPEEQYEKLNRTIKETLDSKLNSYVIEISILWACGDIHWYKCWNQIIRNENDKPVSIQGIMTDITNLKEAHERNIKHQQKLEKSIQEIEQFHQIVSNSPIVVYRLGYRPEWPVEFISENIARWGYAQDKMLSGETTWLSMNHPDGIPNLERIVQEAIDKNLDTFSLTSRIMTASGEIRHVESWNRFNRDDAGNVIQIQGLLKDVTDTVIIRQRNDRILSELEIAVSELQEFHDIVISSNSFTYRYAVTDEFPTLHVSSNIAITGYKAEEFINEGRKWSDLIPDSDYAMLENAAQEALEQHLENYHVEYRMKWKNGETHWYASFNNILRNEHGLPTVIQGVANDITELKKSHDRGISYQNRLRALTQDLLRAEDTERRHLAVALHDDIGQMLAALNMKISVLNEMVDKKMVEELVQQVDELLAHIMHSTKTLTWEISPTSLYETDIGAGLERMTIEMKKFFGLDVQLQTAGARIVLDRDTSALIFRCAKELLVNVAKHAGVKTAELGISTYGDKVHLVVSDKGNGFEESTMNDSSSLGFGLFSMRERIEYIHGSMRVESNQGKGTKIMIIVPLDISELV